jgi:hypothetical protein
LSTGGVYHKRIELRKYGLWEAEKGRRTTEFREDTEDRKDSCSVQAVLTIRTDYWHLRALGPVVDVEEFEGLEDRVFFAGGAAASFAVGWHCGTRDYTEGIAKGLFENF